MSASWTWRTVAALLTAAVSGCAAAQQPRLTDIAVQSSPAEVTVRGTGEPGTAYQLSWTPVLGASAVWKHAGDAVAAYDGTFSMRATPSEQPGFYRAEAESFEFSIHSINQFGNVILNAYGNAFATLGFDIGDVVRVSFGEREFLMPVVSSYAEVDGGDMLCRLVLSEDESQSAVVLAIKNGDFARTAGVDADSPIKVVMEEKGGYLDQCVLRQLGGTTNRADYADFTDEQYANFRMVAAPGIASGILYRSSSPINPVLNRNHEADAALDAVGVHSVLNLADTEESMKTYPGFAETHCAKRDILALAMSMNVASPEFRAKLADALRFIATSQGPWLVHCSHGKDRTGFLCAILECLAGATADAVVADYMESYVNLYHLEPGGEKYDLLAESNIVRELQDAFGLPDLAAPGADLAAAARTYLLSLGLSDSEIDALLANLAGGE